MAIMTYNRRAQVKMIWLLLQIICTHSRGSSCELSGCRRGQISFGTARKRVVCPLKQIKYTIVNIPIIFDIILYVIYVFVFLYLSIVS